MWAFDGKYTGEAKTYDNKSKKKQLVIEALVFSIVLLFVIAGIIIWLCKGNQDLTLIVICVGLGTLAIIYLMCFISYKHDIRYRINIRNDSIEICWGMSRLVYDFYVIQGLEDYEDFIVVKGIYKKPGVVLQKELLIEGDWEGLKSFLKKVEESLTSDDPIYQIEEPSAEFVDGTVKAKRISKSFVGGVYLQRAVYNYFATFLLENGEESEFEIGQDVYEKIEEGDTGTLVLINGAFISFGEGEELEQE